MNIRTVAALAVFSMGLRTVGQEIGTSTSAPTASTSAAVPRVVQFSGLARDTDGKPMSGTIGISFLLYRDEQGGAPLWMETQNVRPDSKGHYSVQLGATQPDGLPIEVFNSGQARWLGIAIAGQIEQPRVLLMAVPYALKAADASTIGGLPPSAFVLASTEHGLAAASNEPPSVSVLGAAFKNSPQTLLNVQTQSPGATASSLPLWTGTSPTHTIGSSVLFQSTSGQVGLNTTSPGASLEVDAPNQAGLFVNAPISGVGAGIDLHTTGSGGKGWEILATGNASAQGVGKLNIRDLSSATDVFTIAPGGSIGIDEANPASNTPLQVTASNPNTVAAIFGLLSSTNPTTDAAVFGYATATSVRTTGVLGAISSSSPDSAAVVGEAQATTGQTYAVTGVNLSSGRSSAGVQASSITSSGVTFGMIATNSSPSGTGALGVGSPPESMTAQAILGCCPVGVWGDTGSKAGGAAGLVGTADDARAIYLQNNSPSGVPTAFMYQSANGQLALQAGGSGGYCTVDTTGHLNCANGTSMMAPVDTGQRQVALYGMQSAQNWFEDFGSGQLTSGAATVTLDRTFVQTVNTASDYHVFLTPESDCGGLYVSRKTETGFEVRELGGGQSNVAFEYRIVALRRGSENLRLEDMSEQWKKMNAPLPRVTPGERIPVPVPRSHSLSAKGRGTVATVRKAK